MTTRILASIFILSLAACLPKVPGFDTYDIDYGDKVTVDNDVEVRFKDLLEDSRCPDGVSCIWPGEAIVLFEAVNESDTIRFPLHLGVEPTGLTDTLIFEEYNVELLRVDPEPVQGVEREKEDYSCRVVVEKI